MIVAVEGVMAEAFKPVTRLQAGSLTDVLFFVMSQASGPIKTVSGTKPIVFKNTSPLLVLFTTTVACCVAFLNRSATGNSKKETEGCEVV